MYFRFLLVPACLKMLAIHRKRLSYKTSTVSYTDGRGKNRMLL